MITIIPCSHDYWVGGKPEVQGFGLRFEEAAHLVMGSMYEAMQALNELI